MEKVYRGDPGTGRVTVDGKDLPLYDAEVKHSSEFAWGYGGSGPAQLAYAILRDHVGDMMVAALIHQEFKFEVIAGLPQNGTWSLTGSQIDGSMTMKNFLAECVLDE